MNYKIPLFILVALLLQLLGIACQDVEEDPGPVNIQLTAPWELTSPVEVGLNIESLDRAIGKANNLPRFQSMLVVKDGKLALEQYFHGNTADSLNDVRSITKSVVSLLTGIALDQGMIQNLDETLGSYLHPEIEELSAEVQAIRIRDLLMMTAGFEWDETTGPSYNEWYLSGDHIGSIANHPLADSPGNTFTYNSATVHLLGVLLETATNMPLEDFADQYLFGKMGIERSRWEELTEGYVNGGSGIDLRPRDLARLGQLILQKGNNGTNQIVSSDWVEQSTNPQFTWRSSYGVVQQMSYGFLWWTNDGPPTAVYAWGYGGQFIYIVPEYDMLVVTTTRWRMLSQDGGPRALTEAVLDIILNDVLAAVENP